MRKKGLPEVTVKTAMSIHHNVMTKVKVELELHEKFCVQVGVHQQSL